MDTPASPQLDENNYIVTDLPTNCIAIHKSNYYSVAYHKKEGIL
jgi:hypothetical protein